MSTLSRQRRGRISCSSDCCKTILWEWWILTARPCSKANETVNWTTGRGEHMEKLLQTLLDDLDAVREEHDEIGDTEVSVQLTKAIHEGFISLKPGFKLPKG